MSNARVNSRRWRWRGWRLFGVPAVPLLALAGANLLPLVGVAALGWDLRGVMLLYWAENIVFALWSVVRMLVVEGIGGVFAAIFFCGHFGFFMAIHLGFVWGLTSPRWQEGRGPDGFFPEGGVHELAGYISCWALAALLISHGISFFRNFLFGGEWRNSTLGEEMGRPYKRMAIMHIALIFGGWLVMLLRQPVGLLIFFVLLKTALDATAHIAEHRAANPARRKAS